MKPRIHFEYWMSTLRARGIVKTMDEMNHELLELSREARKGRGDRGEVKVEVEEVIVNSVGPFIDSGRQTFVLGESMAEMLAETSLDNIDIDDIRPPYYCFWVSVPPETLTGRDDLGDKHDAWGFYVVSSSYNCTISLWAPAHDEVGAMLWVTLAHEECRNMPIERVLGEWMGIDEESNRSIMKAARIAFNLMLYLAQDTAEIESETRSADTYDRRIQESLHLRPSKKDKLVTKLSKKRLCRIRHVAPTIEQSRKGDIARHWVRGHWHTYLYGKDRDVRKMKWIMPYEKNKDNEERKGVREYQV